MSFFILSARDDYTRWANFVDQLPRSVRDVHFSPGYMAAQLALGHEPKLAVYVYLDYVVVQPFIMRDIVVGGRKTGYCDIASAVGGYGGPASNHNHTLYNWFSQSFMEWCRDTKVVSEFCALNPMILPHQKMLLRTSELELRERKQVVVMSLASLHAGAEEYHKRRAQGVASAWRGNVKVLNYPLHQVMGDYAPFAPADFIKLYRATMERQKASPRWMLQDNHLAAMCGYGIVFCAYVNGEADAESAAIIIGHPLGAGSTAYYYLAANAMRHPQSGANDLLVHEVAEWAKAAGFQWLHLGGGATAAEDDPVLFYKAGFSDMRRPAMSYFRVFDPSAYKQLCAAKVEDEIDQTGEEFTTSFEPMYRREAS